LELSRRLLLRLVRTFVAVGGELTFVIDETLERRWGRRITRRGHYHDPLASSTERSVATSGLRWIVLTWVIPPPWTQWSWALPVLSVPASTPEVSGRLGLRHKTVPPRARQMMLAVCRWLPEVKMTVTGDKRTVSMSWEEPVPAGTCAWWPRCGWMRPCTSQLPRAGLALTGVRALMGSACRS
jgi:hypothetical protein